MLHADHHYSQHNGISNANSSKYQCLSWYDRESSAEQSSEVRYNAGKEKNIHHRTYDESSVRNIRTRYGVGCSSNTGHTTPKKVVDLKYGNSPQIFSSGYDTTNTSRDDRNITWNKYGSKGQKDYMNINLISNSLNRKAYSGGMTLDSIPEVRRTPTCTLSGSTPWPSDDGTSSTVATWNGKRSSTSIASNMPSMRRLDSDLSNEGYLDKSCRHKIVLDDSTTNKDLAQFAKEVKMWDDYRRQLALLASRYSGDNVSALNIAFISVEQFMAVREKALRSLKNAQLFWMSIPPRLRHIELLNLFFDGIDPCKGIKVTSSQCDSLQYVLSTLEKADANRSNHANMAAVEALGLHLETPEQFATLHTVLTVGYSEQLACLAETPYQKAVERETDELLENAELKQKLVQKLANEAMNGLTSVSSYAKKFINRFASVVILQRLAQKKRSMNKDSRENRYKFTGIPDNVWCKQNMRRLKLIDPSECISSELPDIEGYFNRTFKYITLCSRGTYSIVYAFVSKENKLQALKLIDMQAMRYLNVEELFYAELHILSMLQHPHILAPLEVLDGEPNTICSAVSHLHFCGIIHRDLKMENILVTAPNEIKICDFGYSVVYDRNDPPHELAGTVTHMAPEMLYMNAYNEKVDIWSIAVNTYEMLTMEVPFANREATLNGTVNFPPDVPYQARKFITAALRYDYKQRPSVNELMDVHEFLDI